VEESKGFLLLNGMKPKITWLCNSRFSPWAQSYPHLHYLIYEIYYFA